MKKQVFGRQFKRDANERKALFKNLLTSLVLEERITTTQAKAKAIKAAADKLVTKAKKNKDLARRNLHADVNQKAVEKLIADIGPRFDSRNGGYTRVIKLGKRRVADNAPMAIIEWSEAALKQEKTVRETKSKKQTAKNPVSKKSTTKTTAKAKADVKATVEKPGPKASAAQKPKIGGFLKQLVTRQKKG